MNVAKIRNRMNFDPSQLLGEPVGELVLEIDKGDGRSQTFHMSGAKCAIGSDERCELRLKGTGVRPVHCVILRSDDHTIVRRWAGNTWLNGRSFDDTTLRKGDELRLANLCIRVVDDERVSQAGCKPTAGRLRHALSQAQSDNDWSPIAYPGTPLERLPQRELMRRLVEAEARASQLQYQLATESYDTAQLIERIESMESQTSNVAGAVHIQQHDAWSDERRELEQDLTAATERVNQLEVERKEQEGVCDRLRHDLEKLQATADTEAAKFEEQRVDLEQHVARIEEKLADEVASRQTQIEASEADSRTRCEELEERRAREEQEGKKYAGQLSSRVADLSSSLARREEDLEHYRQELGNRIQELQDSHQQLIEQSEQFAAARVSTSEVDEEKIAELKAHWDAESQKWQQEQADLKNEIAQFEQRAADAEEQRESLSRELSEARQQQEEQSARLAAASDQLKQLAADVASKEQERQELEGLRQQLDQDRQHLDQERHQIDQDQQQLDQSQQHLDQERQDVGQQQDMAAEQQQLEAAQQELQRGRESLELSREQLAQSQEDLTQSQQHLETSREQFEQSQQQLEQSQVQLEMDRQTLQDEQQQLDDARQALETERQQLEQIAEPETELTPTDDGMGDALSYAAEISNQVGVSEVMPNNVTADPGPADVGSTDDEPSMIGACELSSELDQIEAPSANATDEHPVPYTNDDELDDLEQEWSDSEESRDADDLDVTEFSETNADEDDGIANVAPREDSSGLDDMSFLRELDDRTEVDQEDGFFPNSSDLDEEANASDDDESSSVDDRSNTHDFLSKLGEKPDAELPSSAGSDDDDFWSDSELISHDEDADSAESSAGTAGREPAPAGNATHVFLNQLAEKSDLESISSAEGSQDDDFWSDNGLISHGQDADSTESSERIAGSESAPAGNATHIFLNQLAEKSDLESPSSTEESQDEDFWTDDGLLSHDQDADSAESIAGTAGSEPSPAGNATHIFLNQLAEKSDLESNSSMEESQDDDFWSDDGLLSHDQETNTAESSAGTGGNDFPTTGSGNNTHDFLSQLGEKPDFDLSRFADSDNEDKETNENEDIRDDSSEINYDWEAESFDDSDGESTGDSESNSDLLFGDLDDVENELSISLPDEEESIAADMAAGGELSIEDYMENLLARVGTSPEAVQENAVPNDPTPSVSSESHAKLKDQTAETPQVSAESDEVMRPGEFMPRSKAPEQNLTAMRELANASAQSAINQHEKSRSDFTAVNNFGIALIPMLIGGILIFPGLQGFLPALVTGIIVECVGLYYLFLAVVAVTKKKDSAAAPHASAESEKQPKTSPDLTEMK